MPRSSSWLILFALLSHAEIAGILKISEAAAKRPADRGLKTLRQELIHLKSET